MAETQRKVFPMSTFYAYMTGEGKDAQKQNIIDMLSFVTGLEVDDLTLPFASSVAKAWIYEQEPKFTKFDSQLMAQYGNNVSIPALPAPTVEELAAIVSKVVELTKTNAAQSAKLAELEKKTADDAAKIKDLEAKLKVFKDKAAEGEKKFDISEKKIAQYMGKQDDYIKKLDELLAKIDEVKKAGVVVQGVVGAAGAAGDAGAAPAESSADSGDGFGFGGTGDPFAGDATW